MREEYLQNFQYNSCIARGICSISPKISALQTIIVLYLRLFSQYSKDIEIEKSTENFILNAISITIYNTNFNDESFISLIKRFKEILPKLMEIFEEKYPDVNMDTEKNKATELFEETSDIIQAIKYGERVISRSQENLENITRDLYNIILVVCKSISINLLELESFQKENKNAFKVITSLLSKINLAEKDIHTLKREIYNASKLDCELMQALREAQEERYGTPNETDVSYTTTPNKAVLVAGTNIRELETILEALKNENIDIYTHDDMMLAHTFPKFSEYQHLKGQFGQGLENCLLDFATFPGPIVLTKNSLHNIENLYRGRLFTTDYSSTPKGVIKIENGDFSNLIKSTNISRGFKRGKQCETVTIGYCYEEIINIIKEQLLNKSYNRIFIIGLENYSLEQRTYFEKLIKHTPDDVLIISFSYNIEKKNLIHINTCFDNYSWLKFANYLQKYNLPITLFIPKCDRNTISQLIYLANYENISIYLGKCTPIILNPSLMNTLQETFSIKTITSSKFDLEEIFKDKS